MREDNEILFKRLIATSQTLVQVCTLASENLSEEFKSMVTSPMTSVKEVLNECPDANAWVDGIFSEDDVSVEYYVPDIPGILGKQGVRLLHEPTGLQVESYSSPETQANYERGMRALRKMVERRG